MKKFILYPFFFLITSCGDYIETKIDLRSDQIEAIENFMVQECIQKNADLFSSISTETGDWANTSLDKTKKYSYKRSDKSEKELVILKMTSTVMYVFVEAEDSDESDRVYKYTTTDNTNHLNAIKTIACNGQNSYTGNSSNFEYTANEKEPNATDEDRTEYSSKYTIIGSRPIFFSLFSRSFNKKIYIDDEVDSTTDITVTLTDTSDNVSIADYKNLFNSALHCSFNTSTPAWLGADFTTTFESSLATTCTTGVFDWEDDIES